MEQSLPRRPSLRDLLLSSDLGRANPRRVAELLDAADVPLDEALAVAETESADE